MGQAYRLPGYPHTLRGTRSGPPRDTARRGRDVSTPTGA